MATCGYHFTAKAVSFGKGQSAVHTAAYNARVQLEQQREGRETKDYGRTGGVLFSGIFAPKDAPAWARDREQLWNRAEAAERQKNGQPARNFEFSFPHQLNQQQREWLLKDFLREQFVRKGMIADANIHAPHPGGDARNYHAHVLVTMRELDGDNFAKTKNRDWNRTAQMEEWRERWAEKGARALERAGYEIEAERWRHGHKALEAQREAALQRGDLEYADAINREATTHRGPHVDAMERKGIETELGNAYRDKLDNTETLQALRAELAGIEREISQTEKEARAELDRLAPDDLRGVARDMWEARQQSDSGRAFAAALEDRGIMLARATKEDVQQQREAQQNARQRGAWVTAFREGEVVAITKRGDVYRLTERTTGESARDNQQFTAGLRLESVAGTREIMQHIRDAERMAAATVDLKDGPQMREKEQTQFAASQVVRIAGKAVDYVAEVAGEAIELLGDAFGATAMTPERIALAIDAKQQRAEEAEIEAARHRVAAREEREAETREREKLERDAQRRYYEDLERER